jgi:zinc transport system permease protein
MSVNEELARVDGVAVEKIRFVFMILLALVIAVALKVVGILLITALLIIPAATARLFSKSPKQMVLMSVFIAVIAVVLGLYSSLNWDFPTGPAIVVSASLVFFVSRVFSRSV